MYMFIIMFHVFLVHWLFILLLKARQDSGSDDSGSSPQFYKKDLLMILKERNELKEKIIGLEEELASAQKRYIDSTIQHRTSRTKIPIMIHYDRSHLLFNGAS